MSVCQFRDKMATTERGEMGFTSHRVLSRQVLAASAAASSASRPAVAARAAAMVQPAPQLKRRRGPCRPPRVSPEIRELAPWLTPLQAKRVQAKTRLAYSQLLLALATWLSVCTLPKLSGEHWDNILVDYLEEQLEHDMTLSMAIKSVSAVLWANPHVGRPTARALPCASAVLAGWRALQPPASRPPLPIECMAAIAVRMAAEGDLLMALFVWVSFETYWRPAEGLSLRGYQVLPGLQGGSGSTRHLSFLVRPSEQETPTKTGLFDVSCLLDLPRQQFLVPLLLEVKRRAGDSGLMFPFSHMEARVQFQAAAEAVNVGGLRPTLYSLRHGGASHDRATNSRSAHDVQGRGLWKSSTSVMRYEKHSRLARQLHALPEATRRAVMAGYPGAAAVLTELFWRHWPDVASRAFQSS